jgi:hypothetical protein
MSLMPCFDAHQAPAEGMIIGKLLAGYGELELSMCTCLIGANGGEFDGPIRTIFGSPGAAKRLRTGHQTLQSDFARAGLDAELRDALDHLEWCRGVRNQYAHCCWYWTLSEGLCFVNLEELAKQSATIGKLMEHRHPVDVTLLLEQENFFNYVKEYFVHLDTAYRAFLIRSLAPGRPITIFPKPSRVQRPRLHN